MLIYRYTYIPQLPKPSIIHHSFHQSINQSIQKIEIEIPSTKLKSNIDNHINLWYNRAIKSKSKKEVDSMSQENQIQFLQCKIQFQNFTSGMVYKIAQKFENEWAVVNDEDQPVKLDFKTVRENFIPVG